jgi:DinB family protein
MPAIEEVAKQSLEQRLGRMARTAEDLAAAIRGQPEAALVRRPDPKNWAAKEVICHLRDTEELFMLRLEMIAAMHEPMFPAAGMGAGAMSLKPDGQPAAPDRWAEDRQYLRNDAAKALSTFRKRRDETLAHLQALSPEQWRRGGIHPRRGRMTVDDFVTDMAWHDDNHLDQLRRALEGKA